MLGLILTFAAGLNATIITYRAASLALPDLIAGRLDSYISHMADVATHLRGGQTRLLAVSSEARLPGFPNAATFAEQCFPQLTGKEAFAVMLPARLAPSVASALNAAISEAVAEPAVQTRLSQSQMTPLVLSPADTAMRLAREFESWGPIVRVSGFKPEEQRGRSGENRAGFRLSAAARFRSAGRRGPAPRSRPRSTVQRPRNCGTPG